MDFPPISPEAKIIIAAFGGGMIRLFLKPAQSLMRSVWLVACCVVCGYYFTPIAIMAGGLDESWTGAMGALIGLVGLSVAAAPVNLNYKALFERFIEKRVDESK